MDGLDCKESIYSNEVYDYITDFPIENMNNLEPVVCYEEIDNAYNIVYLDRRTIPNMEANFFEYQSVPKLYGLMQTPVGQSGYDPASLIESGITQVQRPPLSLTGRQVVICIIDTGINYTNPAFLNEDGSSRILAIWDQTDSLGQPPEGFLYGSEYTKEQIDQALMSQNPYQTVPSRDENGHGTAMAGLAAGNNLRPGEQYIGAAPNADLVIVKLKECKQYLRDFYLIPSDEPAYQENDIMLAVKYADSFAVLFERPVVICLGIGTNNGDHGGSSALSRYLSMVAVRRSRAVVVCGGNEGNAAHHYEGAFPQNSDTLTMPFYTQDVEIRVSEGVSGFFLEFWGMLPDVYRVSVVSPGGEVIPTIGLGGRQSITYGFVYEKSVITIDSTLVEPASGEELILFRLRDPTPGIWTFRILVDRGYHNGTFHMWLPISQFLQAPVYFLRPSPYLTLTEPSLAANVICVSTYQSDNNSFYVNSGRGYSTTGAIAPDFAAPGVNVSTLSGFRTGSSFGAAITAGAVAQFMQWAVVEENSEFVESREVRSYFIRGATRSDNVTYPNREWGYGRLNLQGTFESLVNV